MDFTIKRNRKHRREWRCGDYRITLNRRPFGVRVPVRYYACVHEISFDGKKVWGFAAHRRPYRKFEAAIKACETSERFWKLFLELSQERGRRLKKLEDLIDRAKRQKVYMLFPPVSIAKVADSRLIELLNPKPRAAVEEEDECPTSVPSAPVAEVEDSSPTVLESPQPKASASRARKKPAKRNSKRTKKGAAKRSLAKSS